MTRALPPQEGFWHEAKKLAKALIYPPQVYLADIQEKNINKQIESTSRLQYDLQANNHQFQREMEDNRQQFELARLKAQHLMQLENQTRLAREAKKNRKFQKRENRLNREFQAKLTEYIQQCENARIQNRQNFEHFLFEERKKLDIELQRRGHEFQLKLAMLQWQMTRQTEEYRRILDNHPWRIHPDTIRQLYNQYQDSGKPVPPLVIISPPEVDFDKFPHVASELPKMEKCLAEQLRIFLKNHYPVEDPQRPTNFVGGMWDTKRMHGETAAMHLFSLLNSIPAFILESEVDGDYLNFRIASWDIGQDTYQYNSILSQFSCKDFLYQAARNYALEWKAKKAKLMQQFLPTEIEKLEPDNEFNLKQLEYEERLKAASYDKSLDYRVTHDCLQSLFKHLKILHCVVASLAADDYYFLRYNLRPKLPDLLLELIQELPDYQGSALTKVVVKHYYSFCEVLLQEEDDRVPKLALDLADSLAKLPNKSLAREMRNYSIESKLRLRGS